jgi:hypothetical protein
MPVPTGGARSGAALWMFVAAVVSAALLVVGVGSRSGWSFSRRPHGAELRHTFGSPKAVAEAVVAALDRRDGAALEQMAVTEPEFQRIVWPRQPAARPERNVPWEYAWRDLAAKSKMQLRGRLSGWRAGAGEVVDVGFDGETTDYGSYRVLRNSRVTLRDPSGRLTTARLFGSVIEQRGHFKVFSYVVD